MRTSSLVEWPCAETEPGLSHLPKPRIEILSDMYGRGALHVHGSRIVRACGGHGSVNAGVSSEMQVRILHPESPRIPGEGSSALGQSGPNDKQRCEADGKQAKIPAPALKATE